MSARREPAEMVGAVAIFEPTGTSPYYRLKWREPDGLTGDTTAGRTLQAARDKAADLDDRLTRAAGSQAITPLTVIVEEYLAQGRSPHKGKKTWRKSHKWQVRTALQRMLRPFPDARAMDLTREVCETMRAQGGTVNVVTANSSILRTFLIWGRSHQPPYFTPEQAGFIPKGDVHPLPALRGTQGPNRRDVVREVGSSEEYITEEDAPSADEVRGLSAALSARAPRWGGLAPELAASCGVRWGEQFQLRAPDVHLEGCRTAQEPHIHVNWQIDSGARADDDGGRRCRPKDDKTRLVPLPEFSFTGYALREAVRARVEAALAEQAGGTNPQGLLFPAARGGLWWYSAFEADLLLPAMREAGWPLVEWTEVRDEWCKEQRRYRTRTRQRTTAVKPWHSHRHRFARILVDRGATPGELMALGGWESEETVAQRYYRSGAEHTRSGLARFA
jgi:hypothetical protein